MLDDNGPTQPDSWILSIIIGILAIPHHLLCPSWRLLLVYLTTTTLLSAMLIHSVCYVGHASAYYFMVVQLLYAVPLAICSFFYIPLDDSALETQAFSVERQMARIQDVIGKTLCVAIACWIFLWSLCDWRALPLLAFLSYKSLKLTAVYLLHLPSFWDSHAPGHHIPGCLPLSKLGV